MSATVIFDAPDPAWERMVQRLVERSQRDGGLPGSTVQDIAEMYGCSTRTVRRHVSNGTSKRKKRIGYQLTDEEKALYVFCGGCVSRTRREMLVQQLHGEREEVPSHSTLLRAFEKQMPKRDRDFAKRGYIGRRDQTLRLRFETSRRNESWQLDCWEVAVKVLPDRGKKPVALVVAIVQDTKTRVITGFAIDETKATQDTVLAAIRAGVTVDDDGVGGLPESMTWDNGTEFTGDALTEAMANLAIHASPHRPYHPEGKGKVERLIRTLEERAISQLPHYSHGPKQLDGKRLLDESLPMITKRELTAHLMQAIDDYNRRWPHSALGGRTPLEAWAADQTPLSLADPDELRRLLKKRRSRVVNRDGIHFDNDIYIAPELTDLVGAKIEVACMPHDPRVLDVYYRGEFLCEAVPQTALSQDATARLLASRRESDARADALIDAAQEMRRERFTPVTKLDPEPQSTEVIGIDDLTPQELRDVMEPEPPAPNLLGGPQATYGAFEDDEEAA